MSEVVNNIFRRLMGCYGNRFTRMWDGLDIADVKAQWAAELATFKPRAIQHALDHLPESMPPTLLEFRSLCNRCPVEPLPALPAPKADPARIAQAIADARKPTATDYAGPRGWAYRLRDREQRGERLSHVQKRFWREALRERNVSITEFGDEGLEQMKAEAARRVEEYAGA